MNVPEKSFIKLFAILLSLTLIVGCSLDQQGDVNLEARTTGDISETKVWDVSIGENVVLHKSYFEVPAEEDLKMTTFEVSVEQAGNYYITALIGGGMGEIYSLLIDGDSAAGSVRLQENGWQSLTAGTTAGAAPCFLAKGSHLISFAGARLPDIRTIKMDQSIENTVFPLTNYKAAMEELRTKGLTGDTRNLELKQDIGEQPLNPVTRKDATLYDYQVYSVDSSTAGVYVYRRAVSLSAGTSYTFETRATSGGTASDTVLYVYKSGTNGTYSWVNDDGGDGLYSSLTVAISVSGTYYIMVRAFNSNSTGVADLYQDGTLVQSGIPVGGYKIIPSTAAGVWTNFFTFTKTGDIYSNDSYSWVMSGSDASTAKVVAYNDDFGTPGDFAWGYQSRIHTNQAIRYYVVGTFSPSTIADWYIYSNALDTKSGEADPVSYFPNLNAIDRIRSSAQSGTYNCISWSGGITSYWVWPPSPGSTWYNANPLTAFDKYYGNNPARYAGAPTFTRSGATSSNSVVDLWADGGSYTHGSVSRLAIVSDGSCHGYDWESKPGSLARIFHPRHSLNDTSGGGYGVVTNYYIDANRGTRAFTLQNDSIALGYTVIQMVNLSTEQEEKVVKLVDKLPAAVKTDLSGKYEAWKQTWAQYAHLSDPGAYAKSEEYTELLNSLKLQGKNSWAFVIQKHQADGVLVTNLLQDLMLKGNEALLDEAKAANLQRAAANKSSYEVPTLNGNWTAFTKAILDSQL